MSNAFDFGTGNIAVALDVLFPSNVNPGAGVGIDKTGAVWTVSLDTPPLAENISPAPSANYFVAIYDNEQGLYEKVRLDNLVAAATASLDVRTPIGDTNYTVLSSDRYVGLTAQLTVNRTLSLPPANTAAGRELTLQDEVGGLSGAHYWIIRTTGTDTLNGQGSGMLLSTSYGGVKLRSNGTNAWNVITTAGATVLHDASYTANGDEHVVIMATLTAARGVTLPPAAQYHPGQRLLIVDQSGSCSPTLTISITPQAGDQINGSTAAVALQQAFDFRGLISDAVSRWTIVDTSQGAGGGGGGPVHSTDIVDSSALGRALITQTTAAADRTSLGSGLTGDQLFLAASPGAARTTLGSGAVGDAVFISATTGAAQTALGLASGALMPANSVGTAPPASPVVGQLWYDTNGGQLYVRYNDGTSSQWVAASNLNVAGIYLPLTGGTVSGPLTVTGALTASGALTSTGPVTLTGAVSAALRGYLAGLNMTWVSNTQISVSPGVATSDDNTVMMTLAATRTKTLAAWAVGNAGMLDTGTVAASNWYHVYVIERTDTAVVDVLASLSPTAPTLPTSYTKKRRIGTIWYNPTPIIAGFVQNGDHFDWSVPVTTFSGAWGSTSGVLVSSATPTGIICEAILTGNYLDSVGGQILYISSPAVADVAAGANAMTCQIAVVSGAMPWNKRVFANTSGQVRVRTSSTTGSVSINSEGWIDTRGRFD
jgi:hypothetical protein